MEWQVIAIWAIVICAASSFLPIWSVPRRQQAAAARAPWQPEPQVHDDAAELRRRRLRAIGY